jgi:transglutaminase-like putative cysteine protease
MKVATRLLCLGCFIALGVITGLAVDGAASPSLYSVMVQTVFTAGLCAVPGLVWRRLWPLSIVLLVVGCYLLLRTAFPVPPTVQGAGGQLRFYGEQLQMGALSYKTAVYPLRVASEPGLKLFVVFSTYWIMASAAFSALTLRRALPAVILLLALLGYALTVDASPRTAWVAVAFGILSACLLVVSRATRRQSWLLRDGVAGAALGAVGSLLALALLLTAPSVAARPWQDWRTWDPFNAGGSSYSFNWLQNYPELLDPGKDRLVMKVESSRPSYWRASVLDGFTGSAWVATQAFSLRVEPAQQPEGSYAYALPGTELLPAGETVVESFLLEDPVETNYFFVGGDPRSLVLTNSLSLRMNSTRALRVSEPAGGGLRYQVTAVIPALTSADLVARGSSYPDGLDHYLALPFVRPGDLGEDGRDLETTWQDQLLAGSPAGWEWQSLYALNRTIIGDATDPYQITLRIERYMRRFYRYTLSPPASDFSSPYSAFLFDTRAGYCQHFAGTMAILLRFNSIPARIAVGFSAGESVTPGVYEVSTNDAHAWVQAYFPGVGWVDFDPTPGRSLPTPGGSSTTPGFRYPFVDEGDSGWSAPDDAVPTPSSRPPGEDTGGAPPQPGPSGLSLSAWLPWVAGLLALLLGWPVGRALWTRRGLYRGEPAARLRVSLRLLRAVLKDYRVPVTPAHTLEETLTILETHLGLGVDPSLVTRVEAVLFGAREATSDDLARVEALRREVRRRLRKRHGWARSLHAWYRVPRLSGT